MFYTLNLNAKLRPFDRHDLEDLIDEFLSEEGLGATSGGGSLIAEMAKLKIVILK